MLPNSRWRKVQEAIVWTGLVSLLAVNLFLLYQSITRPGVPYTYQIENVPSQVCLGGPLEYDVELTIRRAPITIEVVRAFYQGGRSLSQTFDKRPYVVNGSYRYHLALPLPPETEVGVIQLRAVGSAISYEANGYGLTVNVIDCDEEKGAG